jgi:homoaconitase/3-isopropylmalate dehydratase large subunit
MREQQRIGRLPGGQRLPKQSLFEKIWQQRVRDAALSGWRNLRSNEKAVFEPDIGIDVTGITPMVTWGISPQHAVSLNAAMPDAAHSRASKQAHASALH